MNSTESKVSRRKFLKLGAVTVATALMPGVVLARVRGVRPKERSLSFYNLHTGESLETTYWADGQYVPEAIEAIDVIMRDHRTGDVVSMDRELLDLIHCIKLNLRTAQPFHIISGYRSPRTNAVLNRCSSGVAKNSFHIYGRAVDIRLPGCRLSQLRDAALDLGAGGVGYYPRSRFVHVDTGPVRHW